MPYHPDKFNMYIMILDYIQIYVNMYPHVAVLNVILYIIWIHMVDMPYLESWSLYGEAPARLMWCSWARSGAWTPSASPVTIVTARCIWWLLPRKIDCSIRYGLIIYIYISIYIILYILIYIYVNIYIYIHIHVYIIWFSTF